MSQNKIPENEMFIEEEKEVKEQAVIETNTENEVELDENLVLTPRELNEMGIEMIEKELETEEQIARKEKWEAEVAEQKRISDIAIEEARFKGLKNRWTDELPTPFDSIEYMRDHAKNASKAVRFTELILKHFGKYDMRVSIYGTNEQADFYPPKENGEFDTDAFESFIKIAKNFWKEYIGEKYDEKYIKIIYPKDGFSPYSGDFFSKVEYNYKKLVMNNMGVTCQMEEVTTTIKKFRIIPNTC